MKRITYIIFLSLFIFQVNGFSQIFINEWMTSNSATIDDPDFGASGDWIEIYNGGPNAYNLDGHFLTDNLENKTKWLFPENTSIPPYEFLMVWADGMNQDLHSNFKLTKAGEAIALVNPDTMVLDSIVFNHQQTDVSMGRIGDGAADIGFFTAPTPGTSNTTFAFDGITFYQPFFSNKGGFYETPVEVSLTALGGTLRYTLDGSLPTINSTEYTAPIVLSNTTILRAVVFEPNYIPGKPVTHSYFFNEEFEQRGLPVVSIATNPEYFWDSQIGLYVQNFKPTWEYPINIELFENEGINRAAFNELAGVKVNGQNSWVLPQKMLGIYFDNEYDKNNLEYPLFFDRERSQYDNFILRASGSDWGYSLFRDGLAQEMTAETMNLEKQGFRPSVVYVNGEYMGIHNMRSRTNESFIEDNFGLLKSEFDLISNNGNVEQGDAIAFNELYELFNQDLTVAANYEAVKNIVDLENFTDYFIAQIWSSNSSWGHNQKIWKPKAENSKWRWIMQDFDRGFQGATNNSINYFSSATGPQGYNWARAPLLHLLENEEFIKLFSSKFADHLYATFDPIRISKLIAKKRAALENEIAHHVNRWAGTTSSYGDGLPSKLFWETELADLTTFAQERRTYLIEDLQNHFDLQEVTTLGTICFPLAGGSMEINGTKIPAAAWSGLYFKNLPFELQASKKSGYQFEGWTKGVADTIITKGAEWKYLDNGSNQGTNWRNLSYDDGNWKSGFGVLGYGEADITTQLNYGINANDKNRTSYFRKTFSVENLEEHTTQLVLNIRRDDGIIVYLNGEELLRSNMTLDEVSYDTFAPGLISSTQETTYHNFNVQANKLVAGENVLAVEVHQSAANSSDLSFDMEMVSIKRSSGPVISTNEKIEGNLQDHTFYIANFQPLNSCILPELIDEPTTLTIDCSPYFVNTTVTVAPNITLTVAPGVEIHFAEETGLIVNGNLEVQGIEAEPIIFKGVGDSGNWKNIYFHNTTDVSRLNWVEIIGASKGDHPVNQRAALAALNAEVEMDHLKIVDVNHNPIFAQQSDIILRNSQLHSKVTGDLINVKYGHGIVSHCDFRGNEQVDTDAIDFDEVSNGIIRNNKIYDFLGFNSDGIDLGEQSQEIAIDHNFIRNCSDKAISIGQQSSILASQNVIVNCSQGYAIKDVSSASIDRNTFYNVGTPVAAFEKNIGLGGGVATVTNSIFSNSPGPVLYEDANSTISVDYCLFDTDSITFGNNIFGNPNFQNPGYNEFQLLGDSPAIDAGQDDLGNMIDLGASYFDFSAPPSIVITAINYHAVDGLKEFINIYNPGVESVNLFKYTISNAIDFVFPEVEIGPGETIWLVNDPAYFPDVSDQMFQWMRGKLSNEGETISLTDSHGIIVDQVTYDNEFPWPLDADGLGEVLILKDNGLDNHFAESWKAGQVPVNTFEPHPASEIKFFPNPSNRQITILAEGNTRIRQIGIYNFLGQKIWGENRPMGQQVEFDIDLLSPGTYVLEVNGMVLQNKLVVIK